MSQPTSRRSSYPDGRPIAPLRMDATDHGIVFRHGDGPNGCDALGARDVWVWRDADTFYMHYDGAGPTGWLACLATSKDGVKWTGHGPALSLGGPGDDDSASASYAVTYPEGNEWHAFYLGTPHVTAAPDRVPSFPYLTMKATAPSPTGPWRKQPEIVPFRPVRGTYYSVTASPGHIVRRGEQYLMFFSASTRAKGTGNRRTLGIARTHDLNGAWSVDPAPIVPLAEQVENSSLHFEPTTETWFLFTNHIGIDGRHEFTDAVWVYWTKDLEKWNVADKAVVLDGENCNWSSRCIGLPGVVVDGERLLIYYDAPGGDATGHMARDIGLATLKLPLTTPK